MKLSTFMILALTLVAGAGLYHIKHRIGLLEEEVRTLEQSIRRERDAVGVLQAEWTYLSQPQRLEKLARQFLNLQAPNSEQLIESKELIKMCLSSDSSAHASGNE